MRSVISRELGESLSKHGLLLTPTTPFAAPGFNAVTNEWQMPEPACWYTAAANLSGFPACTYPLATASGLPLGLQLIGKTGDEASLLKAVLLLEKIGIRP
jgi:Asp-tRNA(Asn)/Glu-tRNA(Gln) amidotransferase A subunit family amidase